MNTVTLSTPGTPLVSVMRKAHKWLGQDVPAKATEYYVAHTGKGKTAGISIYEDIKGTITHRRDFKVGDVAEHNSYNLSYFGIILAITEKTVTISEHVSNNHPRQKKNRLTLEEFCWRNKNFDHDKAAAENAITSMSL